MDQNVLVIVAIAILVMLPLAIKFLISAGVNKTEDAIKNAAARRDAQGNSSQPISLADRYGKTPESENNETCTQCGSILTAGSKSCSKCGATSK